MKPQIEFIPGNCYKYVGKLEQIKNKVVTYIEPAFELHRVMDSETQDIYVVMSDSLIKIDE